MEPGSNPFKAVILNRKDPKRRPSFDQESYGLRDVVERCVNWLKESRALASRFDKLAINYLATVKPAGLQQYLRKLAPKDSTDRPLGPSD
jgi:transposase